MTTVTETLAHAPGRRAGTTVHPSASFSATIRVRLENRPGSFASLAEAIAQAGGLLGAIDLVRIGRDHKIRDVTVLAGDAAHLERIIAAVSAVDGIEVEHVSDRTFLMHLGGKLEVTPRHAAQDARRPVDGLHARSRADLDGDRRGPREGLGAHDQAEHRRRRLRRDGRARAR